MSARSIAPLCVLLITLAGALWWTVLRDQPVVVALARPPAPPAAASDAADPVLDAFDLRGEIDELPAGVKFIVPPRLHHEWVNDDKRTLVFGEGDQLLAIVNVTSGKRLREIEAPRAGVKLMAKAEKLEVTSIDEYAPNRIHAQLDGVHKGMQVQQHLIFISLPMARVTIYVRLSGDIILDPRLQDLLVELRTHRVVI